MTIQTQCVPRVDVSKLTPETFRERYQYLGIPVIITGLLHNQRAWDLDYLCEHLGDRVVALRCYGRDRYNQDKRQWKSAGSGVALKSLKFADYAEMLHSHYALCPRTSNLSRKILSKKYLHC